MKGYLSFSFILILFIYLFYYFFFHLDRVFHSTKKLRHFINSRKPGTFDFPVVVVVDDDVFNQHFSLARAISWIGP